MMLLAFWSALQWQSLVLLKAILLGLKTWMKPLPATVMLGAVTDMSRSKTDLLVENALLRHQFVILERQIKRPRLTWQDRLGMVFLASRLPGWRQALLVVQPDTLLRWHRELFKHFWRFKSRRRGGRAAIAPDLISIIQRMATENRLWGAERIRGELHKLGWHVGKGTVLKYLRRLRPTRPPGQTWKSFLHNHAPDIWACDFIQVTDVLFRSLFIFVIIELGSRRVVHISVTRHPTDAWVAQQLREATPFQQGPRYLIRDNDRKYGQHFAAVAAGTRIEILTTPFRTPTANAICERFIGSVRRECLDHLLILGERQLLRAMKEYIEYYNCCRPHQGLAHRIPVQAKFMPVPQSLSRVVAKPLLGGLHHH
jgi:putative transposase